MTYVLLMLLTAANAAAPTVRVTRGAPLAAPRLTVPVLGAALPKMTAPTLGVPTLTPTPVPLVAPTLAPAGAPVVAPMASLVPTAEALGNMKADMTGAKLTDAMTGSVSQSGSGAVDPLAAQVAAKSAVINRIREEIAKVIVGQQEMVDSIIMGMIAGEHVLLEGIPGVAKTQTVKAFADAISGNFQRIQGTPDKLPSDIIGAEILQDTAEGKKMMLEKGPIFANILLVDEINRMMPKTQSSLLEAMQERRVTINRETLALPQPFLLLATQNPIEQEGTYRLPEAQQDRFMFKVLVGRPSATELKSIMDRYATSQQPKAGKAASLDEIAEARAVAEQVKIADSLMDYITAIIEKTHVPGDGLKGVIENGASPRAGIFLMKAAKINAFLQGRAYVLPEDIRAVAHRVLRHRIMLSYSANNMTSDQVIDKILESVPVPKQ